MSSEKKSPNKPKPKGHFISKGIIRLGNSLPWDILDGKRKNGFKKDQMNWRKKGLFAFKHKCGWQHLAQEVLKSLRDKSQQGILREIKLEKEQIHTHQYTIHYCPLSEAAPRFFISFHILAHTEREQSSVPLLVRGDSSEIPSWPRGLYNWF